VTDSQNRKSTAARLKAEADLAASELDEQYRARLCLLVEREMNRRFRPKEDPEDVVQSVFRTFYRRNAQGEFHIDSSVDLWCLLATITRRKILKHVEKLRTDKRNPEREEHVEGNDLRGQVPTPEEAAIAADLIEKSLAGLDETYVRIFHLRLQNHTEEEIAAVLNCNRGRVRTRLNHLRQLLQRLLVDGAGKPADLDDMLRHCLAAPASDYFRDTGQSVEFAAASPLERAALGVTLGELFQCSNPPLQLLVAVKQRARHLMSPGASRLPVEVHQLVYFASIAAALVCHGEKISKSRPEVLRIGWERIAAESYVDEGFRRLFAAAVDRLSD
jgi:RNA polymerase sigma-70 factor (ECF subfamily)